MLFSLEYLAIENNHLLGRITNCGDIAISADCAIPRKIECECCLCYGLFSTPTAYELETPCPSSELVIINSNEFSTQFSIVTEAGDFADSGTLLPGSEHRSCLSETDCYTIESCYSVIIIDNKTHEFEGSISFGYSGNQTLESGRCEIYETCNMTLQPGTHQRQLLNRLFKMYHTSDFINTTSFHYKTLCWWLEDIKTDAISNNIQRYILALLYKSTEGDKWNNNTNWLDKDKHECEWFGVRCDEYNNTINLDLASNNLNGFIPTEISELKAMKKLNLACNNLTGSISDELSKLELLEELDLSFNALRGSIPSYFKFLKSLIKLNLSSNVFTNTLPSEITHLQNIETIILSNNSFSGELPPQLSNLTMLRVFNVSNNLFQGKGNILESLTNLSKF